MVSSQREQAAAQEAQRNAELRARGIRGRINRHHHAFLERWWQLSYPRSTLVARLGARDRYLVCGQLMERPIFAFVSTDIRPNAALIAFDFDDDYSFGILQSSIHCAWFSARCSTMGVGDRYTSRTVYDSFPWPQAPSASAVHAVEAAAHALQVGRATRATELGSLRAVHKEGLGALQVDLDAAVRLAYGMSPDEEILTHLLGLNLHCSTAESSGAPILGPGRPEKLRAPSRPDR
jgi:hypothetical protein